jgi:CHAD domain-containing protein
MHNVDLDAVRGRAFEISLGAEAGSDLENWLRAERDLAVASDYDTADRDLEQVGMALSRLPGEAGVMWSLRLPRGEQVEEWEPGNDGLAPPAAVAQLIEAVVAGKPLLPTPPVSTDPGAVRLRELLAEQRQALLRHDPGVRIGQDHENLHQHRVAARRARAFLRATRRSLDPAWRRSLGDRLRDLGGLTGPVRDLDVLLEHVGDELQSVDPVERAAGRRLLATLAGVREARRQRLLDALDSDAYRQLLADLRLPPRLAEDVQRVELDRIARKELRGLVAAVDGLGGRPDEAAIHGLRIRLKRVRYSTELAAADGKARRRFLGDARVLQDLLGEHQDAAVAEQQLREATVWDEATAVAFLAGRLGERQRTRRERVRERLPAAWKRLRKSGRRLG